MKIKNIIKGIAVAMLLTVSATAQIQNGTMVPLGSFLEDAAGNRYQVVLQTQGNDRPPQIESGSQVPLGSVVQDKDGNRAQVVLHPLPKPTAVAPAPVVAAPAPVVVAPAPVVAAPAPVVVAPAPVVVAPAPVLVQQRQFVYQQAPQPQPQNQGLLGGTGLQNIPVVGGLLAPATGGFTQGAIRGLVTGRDPVKEGLGDAAGAPASVLANQILWGR